MAQNKIKEIMAQNSVLAAIMYLIIGIVMLVCGNGSISLIFYISGILFVVLGILQILTKAADLKAGLITIILGIALIVIGCFDDVAKILVGIILILASVPTLFGAFGGIAEKLGVSKVETGNATLDIIMCVVLLIVGVCLIAGLVLDVADDVADILIKVGGVVLILVGLVGIVKALKN